ncbi:MAG: polyphosphate kinase 2 [Geminicoccaceae bacterium]|nr:polyphosphate kinase 2 [Geminicoccaceae bacterium]MCX8099734.1 polyphosphate kinase 2 [Geminicoccaceae bacterium]MDW8369059.1 polyphosphate kinase 2 [Geminicoccaceae bacterium]
MAKNKKNKDKSDDATSKTAADPTPAAPVTSGLPKMKRKEFEKELEKLQVELVRLQEWTVATGARVIVVFEGRDTAGKGGVIARILQRTSPRVFKHVALPKPSDRERSQLYIQRYITHFPAAGEIVLFDRSWYNRAGVEPVMGFCTPAETERFLQTTPFFERQVAESGIRLIKYFLEVRQDVQLERFRSRLTDPKKHWKLSPMDVEAIKRYWEYTKAYQRMLDATDTDFAPWYLVDFDDQRRGRLALIRHLLSLIPYAKVELDLPEMPKPPKRPDDAPQRLRALRVVPIGA